MKCPYCQNELTYIGSHAYFPKIGERNIPDDRCDILLCKNNNCTLKEEERYFFTNLNGVLLDYSE